MSHDPNLQDLPEALSQTDKDYVQMTRFIAGKGPAWFKEFVAAEFPGSDMYTEFVKLALGTTTVTSKQRHQAKNICFMYTYGNGLGAVETRLLNPCNDAVTITQGNAVSPFRVWRDDGTKDLPYPEYKTAAAAGFDIAVSEETILTPGVVTVAKTGLYMQFPVGLELQIRMRGGTAKRGIILANAPGTVDADYRGEIMLLLLNTTGSGIKLERGERVCQGVFSQVVQAKFVPVDNKEDLDVTARGEGRFNSTGTT